jgi:TctA family transporter
MCAIGSDTSNSNIFDVWVIIRFGVSGCCLSNNKLRKFIS